MQALRPFDMYGDMTIVLPTALLCAPRDSCGFPLWREEYTGAKLVLEKLSYLPLLLQLPPMGIAPDRRDLAFSGCVAASIGDCSHGILPRQPPG